jgi:hypothetical protein
MAQLKNKIQNGAIPTDVHSVEISDFFATTPYVSLP